MAGTGPQIPRDPILLLTPDPCREEPMMNKFWGPVTGGTLVFLGVCMGNYVLRRPVLSGIQKHLIFTPIGAYLGQYLDDYRREYLAEKDAVLRHYVSLHKQDFRPCKPVKYGDILEKWYPIR